MTAIHLVQTSAGCPEAYDAVTEDSQVAGTLYLRHGTFTVTAGDTVVYGKTFAGDYGVFDAGERQRYLDIAVGKIAEHLDGLTGAERTALAVAAALEEAAIADWDAGDGKVIEIYVSQIAPIVERVLKEGQQS